MDNIFFTYWLCEGHAGNQTSQVCHHLTSGDPAAKNRQFFDAWQFFGTHCSRPTSSPCIAGVCRLSNEYFASGLLSSGRMNRMDRSLENVDMDESERRTTVLTDTGVVSICAVYISALSALKLSGRLTRKPSCR